VLRSFRVENHKSIRDEQELSFLPAYDKSRPVVPVAAIFGANASGKSNLLDALAWMRDAVLSSFTAWRPGSGVPRVPFRLDPAATRRPSLYCVDVVVDHVRYTYGFEVDDDQVREEWLYAYPHNRRRLIFERDKGIRFGSTVHDHRARGEQVAWHARANALLLTVAAHIDLPEALPMYHWFSNAVSFGDGGAGDSELVRRLQDDDERASVLPLIRVADLGIKDVTVEAEIVPAELWADVAAELAAAVKDDVVLAKPQGSYVPHGAADVAREHGGNGESVAQIEAALRKGAASAVTRLYKERAKHAPAGRLAFHHGGSIPLGLDDQSAGTRSWIRLVSAALGTLDSGGLLVVDELDASLHPLLAAELINLFREIETNPASAQLLVTTHDPTLLDEDTLRRDEVWFVEKDPDSGATQLFALADFRPRKNENTEGRYLAGAYGAIPVVSDYGFREAMRSRRERDEAA
jgi:uncharacterized protein